MLGGETQLTFDFGSIVVQESDARWRRHVPERPLKLCYAAEDKQTTYNSLITAVIESMHCVSHDGPFMYPQFEEILVSASKWT